MYLSGINNNDMKKAIVYFTDGSKSICRVNLSYSRGGIHYYDLTKNSLDTFLDYAPGETNIYKGDEITSLKYIMG